MSESAPPVMLVTGVSGLLGGNFCAAARTDYRVHACARRHGVGWPGVTSHALDLADRAATQAALARIRPDVIVHLAAATDVNRCEEQPGEAESQNVRTTENLADWAAGTGARLVFMSTDSVFDGQGSRYTEQDTPAPLNCYAASKLQAEAVVQAKVPGHLVVRGSLYGWNMQAKLSLAEWALQHLEAGRSLPGFTDVAFAPVLANTLAEIILVLLRQRRRGIYHAASRDALSKYDFAVLLAGTFGLRSDLVQRTRLADQPMRARRPMNTALDAGKLERETGFKLPTVAEDLQRFRRLRDEGFVTELKNRLTTYP